MIAKQVHRRFVAAHYTVMTKVSTLRSVSTFIVLVSNIFISSCATNLTDAICIKVYELFTCIGDEVSRSQISVHRFARFSSNFLILNKASFLLEAADSHISATHTVPLRTIHSDCRKRWNHLRQELQLKHHFMNIDWQIRHSVSIRTTIGTLGIFQWLLLADADINMDNLRLRNSARRYLECSEVGSDLEYYMRYRLTIQHSFSPIVMLAFAYVQSSCEQD